MSTEGSANISEFAEAFYPRFFVLAGMNHRSIPLALRERFAELSERADEVTQELLASPGIEEVVVLSTCNRVELLVAGSQELAKASAVTTTLLRAFERLATGRNVEPHLYFFEGAGGAEHLFRVACGLDSLVLGEPQILGQVKESFFAAKARGATSSFLNHLFERAFGVAKDVRSHTRLGEHAVSLAYAAREVAEQVLDLKGSRALVLGAGEMGALAAKYLARGGLSACYVANRTVEKAALLANSIDSGVAIALRNVTEVLPDVDVVIGAAGRGVDDDVLISRSDVEACARSRRGRAQLFVDLGVPRNFAGDIGSVENVFLYNVDDLEAVVQRNLDKRLSEARRAEIIIQAELERLFGWARMRSFVPTIQRVRGDMVETCRRELERFLAELRRGGTPANVRERAVIERAAESFAARLLHRPLVTLKQLGVRDELVRQVFEEFFTEPRSSEKDERLPERRRRRGA